MFEQWAGAERKKQVVVDNQYAPLPAPPPPACGHLLSVNGVAESETAAGVSGVLGLPPGRYPVAVGVTTVYLDVYTPHLARLTRDAESSGFLRGSSEAASAIRHASWVCANDYDLQVSLGGRGNPRRLELRCVTSGGGWTSGTPFSGTLDPASRL